MIRINLIPREERVTTRPVGPNWVAITAAVAPVFYGLVLAAVVMVQNHESLVLEELIQQEEAAMVRYGPALKMIDTLTREKVEVQARLDAMHQLDESRKLPVRLLETVNRSIPRFLWVEKVEEHGGMGAVEMMIKGHTFSNLIVSDFINRLEETELFQVVDLEITKEIRIGETRVVEFSLVVRGTATAMEPDEHVAGMPATIEGG